MQSARQAVSDHRLDLAAPAATRGTPGTPATAEAAPALSHALATFALAPHRFPPLARARALDAVTDCVGCMIAGAAEPLAAPLRKVLPTFEQAQANFPSLLLGAAAYGAPADACLYNGAIAHALDYDDTNHPAYAHPSAVLVSALLAVAPLSVASGAALIDAYIVGFEVFGKLGRALNTQHYKRGWHTTSTFGTLAAVVAVGRLLRLSQDQMVMAIGIAGSSAGGLRANFGSMVKPLHAGYAARNGVLAALLAREGFDACASALEHRYGYLSVFNDGIGVDTQPLMSLGESLEILTEHGLALKPYPACGATHPSIEAALAARAEFCAATGAATHEALDPAAIEHVRAGVCEMAFSPLIHVMPHSPLEGKFSLHYCVAAALVFGEVNLATFTQEKVDDPRVRALIPKISMELDERWRDDSEFAAEIALETTAGMRHVCYVPLASGKPERWFSAAQLRSKFDDCTVMLEASPRDAIYEALRALDDSASATALLNALAKSGHPAP